MFTRVIFEHSASAFTLVAFVVAAVIYLTISLRTLRLRPADIRRLGDLPFAAPTPPATRESPADPSH